ncbi:MAG: ABC transporter substrate-binding protein [Proteobacteria bacterium]|nr:ABC transporter substrate-binding protein [Pseudomonadota bacterium]
MKKTFWTGLFALVMVLALTAVVAAEEGVSDTEILVGSHQDLSGPIAGWGIQVKMGLEMAIKEINDRGGIYGRKLGIVIEDNRYDPKTAIMVTNKMINRDHVFAFIGDMGSPTAGATKPIISRKKIPQMFPLTAASLFYEPYDRYSFLGWTPYYDQARAIVKYFHTVKGYTRFGIMYQDDEMGSVMLAGVKDQVAMYPKCKLVGAESYKRGATEFSTQIAKLRKDEPELVVLATIIRETVGALKEAKKIGWQIDMCGMTPAQTKFVPLLSQKAGISADGFYCTAMTPYIYADSPRPAVRKWWKDHVAMFGKEPDMPTTAGYGAILAFEEAAKRAGKDLTREKFVDALETFQDYHDDIFGGAPITFSPKSHKGASGVVMQYVQGGRYMTISEGYIDYSK